MSFPQTPTMPPHQWSQAPPAVGFTTTESSVTGATNMLSMITNAGQGTNHFDISLSDQIHVSATTDSEKLLRLLHFERQMHQSTLETLQWRDQRIQAIEEELRQKTRALDCWPSYFSRLSDSLQEKDLEIQQLRSQIKLVGNGSKRCFRLDCSAPKDRQIKVLRRKLARMKGSPGLNDVDVVDFDKKKGGMTVVDVTNMVTNS